MFDTSNISDLDSIRLHIVEDNRRFATIWAIVQFIYGAFCLFMSFYQENYRKCRYIYLALMAVAAVAFLLAQVLAKKLPYTVYFSMMFNYTGLLGASILIARVLLNSGASTVMIFASVLIFPIMFVNNTLLNIMLAGADILAAVLLLHGAIPAEVYGWCITTLAIFITMGVTFAHFINKARFERYVFAESAVQLAASNAKIAELQTKYAYYDQMTGLKNRRAYSEHVDKLKNDLPGDCFVIIVDINGLKRMNDALGHAAGDELIVGTADCLVRSFKETDSVYRLGGDEFCIISNGTEEEIGNSLSKLKANGAAWKGQYVNGISVSCGSASSNEFSDVDSMIKAADRRMYDFKKAYYEAAEQERDK